MTNEPADKSLPKPSTTSVAPTPATGAPAPLEPAVEFPVILGRADLAPGVIKVLRTIYDPEIPVDVYELGLVYGILIDDAGVVDIRMTLTSPWCPEAVTMPARIEDAVRTAPGVSTARVNIVWDPPWEPSRMSEAARLKLGML